MLRGLFSACGLVGPGAGGVARDGEDEPMADRVTASYRNLLKRTEAQIAAYVEENTRLFSLDLHRFARLVVLRYECQGRLGMPQTDYPWPEDAKEEKQ